MNLHITKSKNAESFYICKSYVKANGSTTSTIVRKLGTLEQLLTEHGPTRDDVVAWAKNEVKIETEKYKKEKETKTVLIPFHADRQLDYDKQIFFRGGYLFLQSVYYQLQMNKICRKLKQKYKFKYDINAILSDLIYTRILEPCSKRSSYKAASEFLEKPSYELHDVYRALDVLGTECDLIQAEVYKNSHFIGTRNDKILYYDLLWSSIFVTLMANKIGGLQFGIYRNCQISSRVFHTAVAALPLTKANRSDFE